MKIEQLLRLWEDAANSKLSTEAYSIRLPLDDSLVGRR